MIGSITSVDSWLVPGPVWVHDKFQNQYEFMIDYKTGMWSWLVPWSVWVHDQFLDRFYQCWLLHLYGFMIGSRSGIDSESDTGPALWHVQFLIHNM